MTLAGDDEHVTGAQGADRSSNGFRTVADLDALRAGKQDLGADGAGVLAARIVVGDIGDVGKLVGDGAHLRTLAAIAIAAAAEDDGEPFLRIGPQGGQHRAQRIGRMGVVDEDGGAVGCRGDEVETSARTLQAFERVHDEALLTARRDDEARRDEGVRGLEIAGERQVDRMADAVALDSQLLAEAVAALADKTQVLALEADGEDGKAVRARHRDDIRRLLGIGVDDGRRAGRQEIAEQPHLGVEIVGEARVVVEMVAGDVGEAAGGELDAVETMLDEPVARRFERQVGDVIGALERGENGVKLDRIGGGVRQDLAVVRSDDADGTEARGSETHGRPDLADEGSDRRLAVGAGDGDADVWLQAVKAGGGER